MKRVVLLIETSREFGRQLINGVARYARLHGPWSFYKEQIGLKSSIPHLTSWKPDGIIMRDSLIKNELIDEYHLFINPTAIGRGMTIFGELDRIQNLNLVKSTSFSCGIVVLKYLPSQN